MGIACEEAKSSNSINRLLSNKNFEECWAPLHCVTHLGIYYLGAAGIWVFPAVRNSFFWKGNNRSSGSLWKEWMDLNILMRDRKFFVKMWRLHHIFCFIWCGIFLWCIASLFFWRKVLLKKLKIIWCGNATVSKVINLCFIRY